MNIEFAKALLKTQDRNLRRIRNIRIYNNGYEYRINYEGGFAAYIAIDRREIGKRNFKYFGGVGAYNCVSVASAMKLVMDEITTKGA